jgi:hypothetical protein
MSLHRKTPNDYAIQVVQKATATDQILPGTGFFGVNI